MIQANEVRIGNWVYETIVDRKNKGCKLTSTQIDGNRIKCIEDGDIVRGIPLSIKILLSCGFVFNEQSDSYRVFSHKEEWILAAQQTTYKGFKIGLPIDRRSDQYITNLFYLHEIQNLYFAVTGKELNVQVPESSV